MSGLEEEFGGSVRAYNVDATTPDAQAAVAELGFSSHGLVVRSSGGEVLWSQPDHDVDIEQAREAIRGLLGR